MAKTKIIVPGDALYILMASRGLTEKTLGAAINESPQTIKAIIEGKRELSITHAVKFGTFFKTDIAFWFNVQLGYDESKTKVTKQKTVRKAKKAKQAAKSPTPPKKPRPTRKPKAADKKPKVTRKPRAVKKPAAAPKAESKE